MKNYPPQETASQWEKSNIESETKIDTKIDIEYSDVMSDDDWTDTRSNRCIYIL